MKFSAQARAFTTFLKTVPFDQFPAPKLSGRVGYLIAAWQQTSVPWFTIALGLLERAEGEDVIFLFDDTIFPNESDPPYQVAFVQDVLRQLEGHVEVVRFSQLPAALLSAEEEAEVDRLAGLHMVSSLKNSFTARPRSEIAAECCAALRDRMARLKHLFTTVRFDHCLAPGGIYASTGVLRYLGRSYQCRTAYYDSGPGSVSLGVDDVAAYCMDIPKIFAPEHADFVAAHKERALAMAREELELRMQAKDRYGYQGHAYEGTRREAYDVLIPLSIFDDASGLGKTTFFPTPDDWLLETVAFLLDHTDVSMAVREHPAARVLHRPEHLGDLLHERFGAEPRLRFISCREKMSTYNLLETARLVLPCSSTVGIEAAAMGKMVVIESSVYYSTLGFVQRAISKEDYFKRIKREVEMPGVVSDTAREKAWLCYFYSQVGSYVDCDFTPQQVDFPKWVRRPFRHLASDPKVRLMSDSFRLGVPSCRLQSEKIFATDPPKKDSLWQRLFR